MLPFAIDPLPCLIARVGAALYLTDIIKPLFQYVVRRVFCAIGIGEMVAASIHLHDSLQRKERSKDYLARVVDVMLCP
jgi:hypothetical protein